MEELSVDISVGTLAGLAFGPRDGRPVLALHGWLDNAATFVPLAPLLPELRIYALDLPGHGRSSHRPPGARYHYVDWVGDVIEAADALGLDRFALLGHSMGAGISILTAGTFPERVERLALIEGFTPLSEEPEGAPARLRRHLTEARRLVSSRRRVYASIDDALGVRRQAGQFHDLENLRHMVERALEQTPEGFVWRHDPRLKLLSAFRLTRAHNAAFLKEVSAPTLIIRALSGLPVDPEAVERHLQLLKDCQVVTLPGAHHLHLDDPAAVARVIGPFLTA